MSPPRVEAYALVLLLAAPLCAAAWFLHHAWRRRRARGWRAWAKALAALYLATFSLLLAWLVLEAFL